MNFYFNQVLDAFSKMNAQLLGELLDPNQTYQNVNHTVFIRKMEELFREFRDQGDEYLEVQSGNCCELSCNPDLIRTAYRLVGNNTRNYLNFRFITEPTADLRDHLIKDIFECNFLRCHEPKDWYGVEVSLWIYDDEKPDFYLNPDELIHTEIALRAEAEMAIKEHYYLHEVRTWLEKYRSTFDFIFENTFEKPDRRMRWESFFYRFQSFERYLMFFEAWEKTLLVETYQNKIELPEEVLIEVILDAEKLIIDQDQEWIHYMLTPENGYKIPYGPPYYLGGIADLFSETWAWFKPQQCRLVEKYFALTDWEVEEFMDSLDVIDPEGRIKSLTFHLEVREKAKKAGKEIPFGLGGIKGEPSSL